jgi:predicted amidohydrolase YtcJ
LAPTSDYRAEGTLDVTHLYTLLLDAVVLPAADEPAAAALAWAEDVVLAIGSREQVRGISRGDSRVVELGGAFVIPLDETGAAAWPPQATLEVGGPADFAILADDPRSAPAPLAPLAVVRGGHVVAGSLAPPDRAGPAG